MPCSPAMSRLAGLLVIVLALLQGSGLDVRLGELTCGDAHHEEEGSTSGCPPECATCPCCVRVTFPPIAPEGPVAEPDAEATALFATSHDRLPSPPPRGILHVPRLMA